ncbi:MAG: hypothetical protein IJ829_08435 [Kiritimatiellae bacterium]|nr:hypothetical protein [Kiritimatiellia bacterium]
MGKWFEETRLMRHPLAEIGLAFVVREVFGNDCRVNKWDLRETFGPKCVEQIGNLQRAGILVVEPIGDMLQLRVVASGDRKRERCRKIGGDRRAIGKFERSVILKKKKQ